MLRIDRSFIAANFGVALLLLCFGWLTRNDMFMGPEMHSVQSQQLYLGPLGESLNIGGNGGIGDPPTAHIIRGGIRKSDTRREVLHLPQAHRSRGYDLAQVHGLDAKTATLFATGQGYWTKKSMLAHMINHPQPLNAETIPKDPVRHHYLHVDDFRKVPLERTHTSTRTEPHIDAHRTVKTDGRGELRDLRSGSPSKTELASVPFNGLSASDLTVKSDAKRVDQLIQKVHPGAFSSDSLDPYKTFNELLTRQKGIGRRFGKDDLGGYASDWNSQGSASDHSASAQASQLKFSDLTDELEDYGASSGSTDTTDTNEV